MAEELIKWELNLWILEWKWKVQKEKQYERRLVETQSFGLKNEWPFRELTLPTWKHSQKIKHAITIFNIAPDVYKELPPNSAPVTNSWSPALSSSDITPLELLGLKVYEIESALKGEVMESAVQQFSKMGCIMFFLAGFPIKWLIPRSSHLLSEEFKNVTLFDIGTVFLPEFVSDIPNRKMSKPSSEALKRAKNETLAMRKLWITTAKKRSTQSFGDMKRAVKEPYQLHPKVPDIGEKRKIQEN